MIPTFPDFAKLEIKHKQAIQKFDARFAPYHDFSFTNLFCWNTDNSTEISLINNNLVVRLPDYVTGQPVTSILGNTLIDESLEELFTGVNSLKLVPELVIENITNKQKFTVVEDRDNFDYIYNLANIVNLAGGKFKKKRNKTNAVRKAFSERIEVKTANHFDEKTIVQLWVLFSQWAEHSRQSAEELQFERKAISILFNNSDDLGLLLTTVSLDSKLVAFSINEIVGQKYAICHFEKSLPVHKQISTFIAWQAAKDLLEHGCSYVNWEPDLGIPGLRKSKLLFQPDYFLKKYTVKS